MKSLCVIALLVAATLVPAATRWPYPGLQTESPLKLVEIIASLSQLSKLLRSSTSRDIRR